jgi:hypothetical protein
MVEGRLLLVLEMLLIYLLATKIEHLHLTRVNQKIMGLLQSLQELLALWGLAQHQRMDIKKLMMISSFIQ